MDLAKAARSTLVSIPGEKVDAQFASLLPSANEKSYPLLIEIVGQRQIEATDELITALKNSDKNVRTAALGALGKTVNLKNLSLLISQVIEPKHPEDSAAALQALKVASIRMSDREACATKLANALNRLPAAFKSNLLELLSEVGGDKGACNNWQGRQEQRSTTAGHRKSLAGQMEQRGRSTGDCWIWRRLPRRTNSKSVRCGDTLASPGSFP